MWKTSEAEKSTRQIQSRTLGWNNNLVIEDFTSNFVIEHSITFLVKDTQLDQAMQFD